MARKKALVETASEKQLNQFEKNWANDQEVCSRFLEYFTPRIQDARNNRLELEDQWIDDLRLWSCRLDDMGYVGRSNVFIPELHAQVELSVEKSMSALFPGPELIRAIGINGTPQEKANKIANAVDYELSQKINLFVKQEQFERNKLLFGTAIYKTGFRKDMKEVFTRDVNGKPIKDIIPKYLGATCDIVDIFRWYIYPETGNLLDHDFIFEDQWYSEHEVKANKEYVNLDQISTSSFDKNHQWVDAERFEIVNISSAASVRKNYYFLTEVWAEFDLNGKDRVPVRGVIANNGVVIHLSRNKYWYQSHPYLGEKYINRPGNMFYGFSLPDKIRSPQYQINDVHNQTMDSMQYTLTPVTVVDPGQVGDINSMKFTPGARWFGSPEGIKPIVFPDVSGPGLRFIQELRGQIAQFSDTQPGVAPQLQGKVRSATQAQIINQNVTQGQRVRAKSIETSVLQKLARIVHSNLKQFMEEDWQIKYQGAMHGDWIVEDITPSDIWGEAEWVWLGVSAAEKTAVRSQQLLAFQQQVLQAATIMGPGEVDIPLLLKKIASEALDLRDMDDLFESMRKKKTVDPSVENTAILMGRDVQIHYGDDDDYHIDVVNEIIEDESLSDQVRLKAIAHREAHEEQKYAKEQLEEMKARMQQQNMAMQQQQIQPQSGDGREGPAVPSPMEGNQQQVSSSMDGLMTGVRGVEPNL